MLVFLLGCGDEGGTAPVDAGGDAAPPNDAASGTITVQGTVIDQASEAAVAGASVFVTGAAGVITDAAGHFRVSGVVPPYDVAVRPGGTDKVRVFREVVRSAPTLVVDASATARTAQVKGFATVTSSSGDTLVCTVTGSQGLFGFATSTSAGTSPIAWDMNGASGYPAQWSGGTSVDGIIHCFLEQRAADTTLTAAYHGSRTLTLASSGAFAGQDETLTSVPLATVSGTFVDPDASGTEMLGIGPSMDDGGYYSANAAIAAGAFTKVVPY